MGDVKLIYNKHKTIQLQLCSSRSINLFLSYFHFSFVGEGAGQSLVRPFQYLNSLLYDFSQKYLSCRLPLSINLFMNPINFHVLTIVQKFLQRHGRDTSIRCCHNYLLIISIAYITNGIYTIGTCFHPLVNNYTPVFV